MNARQLYKNAELMLKRYKPDIMLAAGITLSAASVIEFCKRSKNGLPVVDQYKENLYELAEDHDDGEIETREYRKAVIFETAKAAKELGKVYWLPSLMWGTSTVLIVGSHAVLKDRNAALTAIAGSLGAELKELHKRIADKYGEEADKELTYETETKESENGEAPAVPVIRTIGGTSMYARFFDEYCSGWVRDAEYNLVYLLAREKEANARFNADGVLFLNDVYDMLGMKRTKAGQHVGWKKGSKFGDGYISFGIYNPCNKEFINKLSNVARLDFNVDGVILESMPDFDLYGNVL